MKDFECCKLVALPWIVDGEIDMAPIVTHLMPIELSESRGDGVVKVGLMF